MSEWVRMRFLLVCIYFIFSLDFSFRVRLWVFDSRVQRTPWRVNMVEGTGSLLGGHKGIGKGMDGRMKRLLSL